jgi:hypothetical protein
VLKIVSGLNDKGVCPRAWLGECVPQRGAFGTPATIFVERFFIHFSNSRMSDEKIEFSAKYKDWLVVKRLSITDQTPLQSVLYILANIWGTIESKLPDYLAANGVNIADLDAQAEKLAAELSKKSFRVPDVKDELTKEVAKLYASRKVLELAKWPININIKTLQKLERKT